MKKNLIAILAFLIIGINLSAEAHYHHGSCPVYLVNKDYVTQEQYFNKCKTHYVIKETIIFFYSHGTRRSFTNCTIYNTDGTILETDCLSVKHLLINNKHFFVIYKNGKYSVINDKGEFLTTKKYKQMTEVGTNKLLVKLDKKFGIIDINENIIVPIKYKKFEKTDKNLFITKLNGYYGMIDNNNQVLVKNEYEKITPLYETYLLKKYGLYGLADKNGKIILEAENGSIKKLGEFIIVKQDKKYNVYDASGMKISEKSYKKIRLNRNTLEGKLKKVGWVAIQDL